jgi:circadian clock protein KaiB
MTEVPPTLPRPLRLRLYVAGDAPNSLAALANLKAALATVAEDRIELEIIDLLQQPERGLADEVFMTPMLVRHGRQPERRMLGNLSATGALRGVLVIDEARDE